MGAIGSGCLPASVKARFIDAALIWRRTAGDELLIEYVGRPVRNTQIIDPCRATTGFVRGKGQEELVDVANRSDTGYSQRVQVNFPDKCAGSRQRTGDAASVGRSACPIQEVVDGVICADGFILAAVAVFPALVVANPGWGTVASVLNSPKVCG